MINEYITVFCASIGFYFLLQLLSLGCFYFLDFINGGKEFNVSFGRVSSLTLGTLVPLVLTYLFHSHVINLTGVVGLVIVLLLMALMMMSVTLQSYALFLRKDDEIVRQKNLKEEDYEFLKGLY
ncbi:MAG: hypothetical protein IPJ13_25660 [Saprospiraceae bacterium]|nr:hypothetical protein [Saprospiraceae bacterium]